MSYQVIARKWRPTSFSEVVGQTHVVKTLQNAIESGRIAHAYLFSGPRGVGKTTMARILAKALNCEKGPAPEPCNECSICKEIGSGYSTDVLEIDGASNTHVDNIRELRESVKYSPSRGRFRIYIIDEVHMLSSHAFNALLKTLEEPPPHVIFVFATTEPHKIPATIHSRCQRFEFRRIPTRVVAEKLKEIADAEGIAIDDEAVYLIARESEGSLRDAQSMLDQLIAFSGERIGKEDVRDVFGLMDRSLLATLLECIVDRDGAGCLNVVEKINDFGYDLKKLLGELIEYVRDLIVIKVCDDRKIVELPENEFSHLKGLSERIEMRRADLLFSVLSRGYEELTRSSTPRFSLEMTLLRACNLEDLKDIAELLRAVREAAYPLKEGAVNRGRYDPLKEASSRAETEPEESKKATVEKKKEGECEEGAASHQMTEGQEGFKEFVAPRDERLYDALVDAVVSFDGRKLSIVADPEGYVMLEVIKKKRLEELVREYFKRNIAIEVKKNNDTKTERERASVAVPAAEDIKIKAMKILGAKIIEERSIDDA